MSNRIEKVNSLLEQEIGKILLRDFTVSPNILITITRVETTGNLIEAKVYISIFPDEKSTSIMQALDKSIYDIQHKINRTLRMRPIPKIIFVRDKEISKAAKVEELLVKVKDQDLGIRKVEKSSQN